MEIKETVNPVGTVHEISSIESYLNGLALLWDSQNIQDTSWWKSWKKLGMTQMIKITNFLIKALDDLIALVDDELGDGADKKATVINAIGRLYDYIAKEAMPVWMKPFSIPVKTFIIDTLISSLIDWIVDKYKNGEWRKQIPEPLPLPKKNLI